jgi:transcription initiation factor TFIIB
MVGVFGVERCDNCGGTEFIHKKSTREIICKTCGFVVKTLSVDMGPEWRTFEGDETDRARAGPPQSSLIVDRGITTVLGNIQEGYGRGAKVSETRRREIQRIKSWIYRTSGASSQERNLQNALNTLQKLGEKLNVPKNVLERAAQIYRMALDKDLVRGRAITSIVAASLYLALREFQMPRTFKSMARHVGIDRKELGRCYRLLVKELNIKTPVINPSLYVRSIVSRAGLSSRVSVHAEKIINLAKKLKITAGKDPVGLASAAVYYAALLNGYKITQRDIANAAEITEVTVRNRCKYLMEDLGFKSISDLRKMLEEEGADIITVEEYEDKDTGEME